MMLKGQLMEENTPNSNDVAIILIKKKNWILSVSLSVIGRLTMFDAAQGMSQKINLIRNATRTINVIAFIERIKRGPKIC